MSRPGSRDGCDVCYIITHGFSARMILDSTVLGELRQLGLNVTILCPDANEPAMQARARAAGCSTELLPQSRLAQRMVSARLSRYLFEDVTGNPALLAKHRWDEESPHRLIRLSARALLPLSRLARRVPALPRAGQAAQTMVLRRPDLRALLTRLNPRLVVSTYPVHAAEASALLEARRAGIKTVIQLLSWDNITCKGRFPVLADQYLSWGSIMSSELGTTYGIPAERIVECGVPHFDQHVKAAGRAVSASRRTIFFGMSSPVFAPREIDVVEWLARQVEADRFGHELDLVIRPHPQNVSGNMADRSWLPRLQALVSGRVSLDIPAVTSSALPWSMAPGDLTHLVHLLGGAAVTINSGSTLSIDALMQEKPVVLTLFDADDSDLPWHRSARRLARYPHLQKLIQLGGVRVTGNFSELGAAIEGYLDQPRGDAAIRERARLAECGPRDGGASRRVAQALADFCHPQAGSFAA